MTANEDEDESATAHFFLGAGDEGLGTCGIGMRTGESDSELLEDEEDEVVSLGRRTQLGVGAPVYKTPSCSRLYPALGRGGRDWWVAALKPLFKCPSSVCLMVTASSFEEVLFSQCFSCGSHPLSLQSKVLNFERCMTVLEVT